MSRTAIGACALRSGFLIGAVPGTGTGSLVAGIDAADGAHLRAGIVIRGMSLVLTVAANPFQTR